ncbi:hypothetical protein C8J56DRAFT_974384 [Mycena floridula]|nr:hypothetical protein C8J56DRAFT_974384 [Mycena floridula]
MASQIGRAALLLCTRCQHQIPAGHRDILDATHLRSTYVPLDGECKEVRSYLAYARADIELYEEEIISLERKLGALKHQRKLRKRDLSSYRSLLSPARRFPFEVWVQIFALSMTGYPEDLHLAHVCIRWRDILSSSPSSWKGVKIDLDSTETSIVSFLQTRQRFSQQTPVMVEITFPDPPYPYLDDGDSDSEADSDSSRIAGLRVALTKILDELQFTMTDLVLSNFSEAWIGVIRPLKFRTSRLTSFEMREANDHGDGDFTRATEVLLVSPNIRRLSLANLDLEWFSNVPSIPRLWDQLLEVDLRSSSLLVARDFLARAASLIRFAASELSCSPDDSYLTMAHPSVPVSSDKLSELSIDADTYLLLRSITIPSLTSLVVTEEIQNYSIQEPAVVLEILPFLQRSSCTLQAMTLRNVVIHEDTLISILRETPLLRTLEFSSSPSPATSGLFGGEVYPKMVLSNDSIPLAPHLTSLAISTNPDVDFDLLFDMVRSRLSDSNQRLMHCQVRLRRKYESIDIPAETVVEFCARVEELRRAGMRFDAELELD